MSDEKLPQYDEKFPQYDEKFPEYDYDDQFPQYDEQYLQSDELLIRDEKDVSTKIIRELRKNIAHHDAISKIDREKLQQILKKEQLLISKGHAFLSLRDVIYITELILSKGKPVKKAFVDCEIYFQHGEGWADKAIRYDHLFGYMNIAFKFCKNNKNANYLLMTKYPFFNDKLISSYKKYSPALNELKRQRKITLQFHDINQTLDEKNHELKMKNVEVDNLKSQLTTSLCMSNEKRVVMIKSIDPMLSNVAIARMTGMNRDTVKKYLHNHRNAHKVR